MCTVFVERLSATFAEAADPALAEPMQRYMKGQFPFHGIKAPLRRQLQRDILQETPIRTSSELKQTATALYEKEEREYQYAAADLLYTKRKILDKSFTELLTWLITKKSWWDTVDSIASRVVGAWLEQYPALVAEVITSWRNSSNIWLRRSCLLYQLGHKEHTDTALLLSLVEENAASGEFFIQKAIGWALRQYSYTDEAYVKDVVDQLSLSPLSRREALRATLRLSKTSS